MDESRVILSGIWVAVMLIFLLGDVIRIFAGHADASAITGSGSSQVMWMVIAVIMLTPILMVVLTLILPYPAVKWVNIAMAVFWILFNIFGMLGRGYQGVYDYFLLIVSMVFNGLTIWYAWKWV